jgi:predicted N-acetyltransferase YhbS
MRITQYTPKDAADIEQLFVKTFSDSEGPSEGELIGHLVRDLINNTDSDDLYCFIASQEGQIIASVFFSRMIFESDINAFILSPMATLTDYQGKGIGQTLINDGLEILKRDGVEIVLTYGDINFYSKVGFRQIPESLIPAPFKLSVPEGWLGQSLNNEEIKAIGGTSQCVQALRNPALW